MRLEVKRITSELKSFNPWKPVLCLCFVWFSNPWTGDSNRSITDEADDNKMWQASRKKKNTHTRTHVTSLSLINVSTAAFLLTMRGPGKITDSRLARANYPRDPLAHPSRSSVTLSLLPGLPHLPLRELKGSRALCMYVHNWHLTVISNSYQRRVLGWEEQWGPDKSAAPLLWESAW